MRNTDKSRTKVRGKGVLAKTLHVLLCALLLGVALSSAVAQEPKRGGKLIVAQVGTPRSMHSIIDPGLPGITILNITEEGLLGMTSDGNIVPVLAKGFPENPDPLTYIFHLREGVLFHSGEEMTAEDVVYTFERLYLPDSEATFRGPYQEHIENVEALDNYTVKFTLRKPWPIFLSFVAGNHPKIVNKSFVEAAGDQYGITQWDGTGPFRVVEWVRDSHVRVVRHENYWQEGKPYLDEIEFRVIPEPSTQLASYQTGEVDIILDPSHGQIQVYERFPNTEIYTSSSNAQTLMVFRTKIPPMDDPLVRRAISLAIDRQALIDTVLRGRGSMGGPLFPPHHWAHNPEFIVERDLETAKQLLEEAGYSANNPLEFTVIPLNEALYVDQATLIQRHLADAGIRMNIRTLEYTSVSAMTNGPHEEWAGDAAIFRITPLRGTAFEFTWNQYHSEGPLNRSRYNRDGYQNPRAEELINEAIRYSDYVAEERVIAKELYDELNRLVLEDAPQIILNYWDTINIVNTRVQGFEPSPVNTPLFTDVWINQ